MQPQISHPALVLSTLPHYLTLCVPLRCHGFLYHSYPLIISFSTFFSLIWHIDAQRRRFYLIDYGFAALWTCYDIALAFTKEDISVVLHICYMNFAMFLLNKMIDKTRTSYVWNHSLWHLLNAAKCYTVAILLQCN